MSVKGYAFKSRNYIGSIEPPATVLEDESRFGNDGAFLSANNPNWVWNGKIWVLDFDGADDKIVIPQPWGDVDFKTIAFSVKMWVKPSPLGSYDGIFLINPSTATNFAVEIITHTNGKVMFTFVRSDGGSTGRVVIFTDVGILSNDVWTNLLCTYDGNGTPDTATAKIYADASLISTSISAGHIQPANANSFTIGKFGVDSVIDGQMLPPDIMNYALSAEEGAADYQKDKHWFGK